jgi:hypothetical protein
MIQKFKEEIGEGKIFPSLTPIFFGMSFLQAGKISVLFNLQNRLG